MEGLCVADRWALGAGSLPWLIVRAVAYSFNTDANPSGLSTNSRRGVAVLVEAASSPIGSRDALATDGCGTSSLALGLTSGESEAIDAANIPSIPGYSSSNSFQTSGRNRKVRSSSCLRKPRKWEGNWLMRNMGWEKQLVCRTDAFDTGHTIT